MTLGYPQTIAPRRRRRKSLSVARDRPRVARCAGSTGCSLLLRSA